MTLQDHFINNIQLRSEWSAERNLLRPESLPTHSREKVWWRCDKGHEWQAAVDSRVHAGRSCPICTNRKVLSGENDLAAMSPQTAAVWHPTLNGTLTADAVSPGSKKRVWWRCERGHDWQAPVYSVSSGSGCPYCAGKRPIVGETDLATTHPHVAAMWSPRNKLAPTEVTAGSHKKALFVCERDHEWEMQIDSATFMGSGCPYCAGKRAIPGETDLATLHPDLMTQWDYERNGELSPSELLPSSHDKAWWKCELGHSWQAVVFSRTKETGSGCPYCTGKKVLTGFNDLATLKPALADEWYQPLNGELKPEDVSLGSNKKVWWQCGERHVWQAAIYARTRKKGTGCPICAGTVKQKAK